MGKFGNPAVHIAKAKKLVGNGNPFPGECRRAVGELGRFKSYYKYKEFGPQTPLYGEYLRLKAQSHAGLGSSQSFKVAAGYLEEYWRLVEEGPLANAPGKDEAARETVRIFMGGLECSAVLLQQSGISNLVSGGEVLSSAKSVGWKRDWAVGAAEGLGRHLGRLPKSEQVHALREAQVQLEAIIGRLQSLWEKLLRMMRSMQLLGAKQNRGVEEWAAKGFSSRLEELKGGFDSLLEKLGG